MTFWCGAEPAYLSSSICVPAFYRPFSSEQTSLRFLCKPSHTHTPKQTSLLSMSKPSKKTGCGLGVGGKIWVTYPERFKISQPLDFAWRHSGCAYFLSVRIKISLSFSHESTKNHLKKGIKNLRCLPPGDVRDSPQEYRANLRSVQLISIYCLNGAYFHLWEMRTIFFYLTLFK